MSKVIKLIKMSSKGQLVVPKEIRKEINFKEGERFIAIPLEEGVYFKKINMPNLQEISKEVEAHFKKSKVTKQDLKKAIKWARKE